MKRKVWQWSLLLCVVFFCGSLEAGGDGIGQRFMEKTRLSLLMVVGSIFKFSSPPPPYKEYPKAKRLELPVPNHKGLILEEVISRRRSIRNYTKQPLSLSQLSQLLYAAQGVTGKYQGRLLRATPSAGALYPLEIYPVINNVSGLEPGIYHYGVKDHILELVKLGDFSKKATKACLDQEAAQDAQVTFFISSIFARVSYKYGERGYRYALIETGHVGQNIYLEAVSLGLGAVAMGAFYDDKVNELLGIEGKDEAVVYVLAVGNIRK